MQQYPPQEIQYAWPPDPQYYEAHKKGPQEDIARLYQEEEYRRASLTNAKGRPKPNYRPVSLRWWYISLLIVICLTFAGLVLWADRELQKTDDTADIEPRGLGRNDMNNLRPRQETLAPEVPADSIDPAGEQPTIPQQETLAPELPAASIDPAGEQLTSPRQETLGPEAPVASIDPAGEQPTIPPVQTEQPAGDVTQGDEAGNATPPPASNDDGSDNGDESDNTNPTPTEDSGDAARGRLTTGFVEVPFTSWTTKPGPKTTITTFTTSKVTTDVVETLTSTIPGTTYFEDGPSETEVQPPPYTTTSTSVGYNVDPSSNETTPVTEYVTMTVTPAPQPPPPGDGGGNQIVQPPVTKKIVTTYKKDAIKTIPVTLTRDGPPITYAVTGRSTLYSTFTVGANGKPLGKVEAPVTQVITSEAGGTERTYVETPSPTTFVSYGPDGLPVTVVATPAPITRVTSVPPTRMIITSVTTPTAAADDLIIVEATTYTLTSAGYYIGKFVPPLLAVLLALAVRAVDQTAKLYQPFAALAHPKGAAGRDSLTLHFEGWKGFWRPFGLLGQGHAVPFLTTMAVWLSSVLAPIASEAIGLKVHGRCASSAIEGCALNLGVSKIEAYILVGFLVTVAALLTAVLVIVTTRWKTGVFADPWCIAGAAALARNPDVRAVGAPDFGAVKAVVAEKQFTLGWYRNDEGREEYGLVLCDESGRSLRGARREEEGGAMMRDTAYAEAMAYRPHDPVATQRKPPAKFAVLTFWWRAAFLVYLLALLGIVLFYHWGKKVPSDLRRFMEGQRFGARFVSSALGVIAILCWECVFCSIVIVAPYRRMADRPQSAGRSILAGRPVYAVTGVFAGIGSRDVLLFSVSLMAVVSDFLPMLLANVPYNLTQTANVHTVCSRVSAGVLGVMIVVLVVTMFARWPQLPVDPRSIAGEMWYVAEARWVEQMEGLAALNDRERRKRLQALGGRWYYGMTSTRLGDRMAVELHDIYGATDYGRFR